MFASLEAGGTKFVCGLGTGPGDLITAQFPTTTPAATLADVVHFFKDAGTDSINSLGIGSFGPVDLDRSSPGFGHITSTPKQEWQDFDLAGTLGAALGIPVGFDTDVNVLAEEEYAERERSTSGAVVGQRESK